jgi:His/Glu/Gln/Arg/opine family amino acid ABC transporter permease subunit
MPFGAGAMSVVGAHWPQLLAGMITTLEVALASLAVSLALGFSVGIARATARGFAGRALLWLVDFFRGIPILILMYFAFFGLPQLGFRTSSTFAAIAALGLYAGALAAEIVRGAIVSIPRGQIEAADALGLSAGDRMRLVVLPQALRRTIPPFIALFALIVESSSLSALIGVNDLLQSARTIVETNIPAAFAIYAAVLVLYFAINYPISIASQQLEKRLY